MNGIVIENKKFSLVLSEQGVPQSLIFKETASELLSGKQLPFVTLTEERPFDNNIKLAHPCKRSEFAVNRVSLEGDRLICGFELINSRVAIKIKTDDDYIGFEFDELLSGNSYGLAMDFPPVCELRFMQLALKERENFGEWLGVSWDSEAAVSILATCPFARIDNRLDCDSRVLTADALAGIKLTGCSAALVVSAPNKLLDVIERIEEDYSLPHGARNRRGEKINRSCYWSSSINPTNVDTHIKWARRAGFSMMLIYYPAIFRGGNCYDEHGGFTFLDTYPNGHADLKAMLDKIKAAGITVGLHILHTHIGLATEYVKNRVDHRLRLKEHFTLSASVGADDTAVFVEENPEFAPRHDACRTLRFGGELITYESVSTERPYCFKGCSRGAYDTVATSHSLGDIGGVLDISEYCATSAYIDQRTSLQDEIADKVAEVYSAGFEFIYFDGSEGTNAPYEIYIPYAQYRVYKKLNPEPLFCEGAAKAHFSWHMLAGGNAFDIFGTKVFKEMTDLHPAAEAERMKKDFTRINFGWWAFREDTQPDIIEYGTSRAAGYDCPGTLMENVALFESHKRMDDILEVVRRWEYAREHNILTEEQKKKLRVKGSEHTLLINEAGEYELCECCPLRDDENISAFLIEREQGFVVSVWHKTDKATILLPLPAESISYFDDFGKPCHSLCEKAGGVLLPVEGKRYLKTNLSREEIASAFEKGIFVE